MGINNFLEKLKVNIVKRTKPYMREREMPN